MSVHFPHFHLEKSVPNERSTRFKFRTLQVHCHPVKRLLIGEFKTNNSRYRRQIDTNKLLCIFTASWAISAQLTFWLLSTPWPLFEHEKINWLPVSCHMLYFITCQQLHRVRSYQMLNTLRYELHTSLDFEINYSCCSIAKSISNDLNMSTGNPIPIYKCRVSFQLIYTCKSNAYALWLKFIWAQTIDTWENSHFPCEIGECEHVHVACVC